MCSRTFIIYVYKCKYAVNLNFRHIQLHISRKFNFPNISKLNAATLPTSIINVIYQQMLYVHILQYDNVYDT